MPPCTNFSSQIVCVPGDTGSPRLNLKSNNAGNNIKNDVSFLKCRMFNARSLNNKLTELHDFLNDKAPDIV